MATAVETFGYDKVVKGLKRGKVFARQGWNGKGMFIYMNMGSTPTQRKVVNRINGVSSKLFEVGDEGTVTRMPNINFNAADGSTVVGWLASQTDMFAEDWVEVKNG